MRNPFVESFACRTALLRPIPLWCSCKMGRSVPEQWPIQAVLTISTNSLLALTRSESSAVEKLLLRKQFRYLPLVRPSTFKLNKVSQIQPQPLHIGHVIR